MNSGFPKTKMLLLNSFFNPLVNLSKVFSAPPLPKPTIMWRIFFSFYFSKISNFFIVSSMLKAIVFSSFKFFKGEK